MTVLRKPWVAIPTYYFGSDKVLGIATCSATNKETHLTDIKGIVCKD